MTALEFHDVAVGDEACLLLMRELRPHLGEWDAFQAQMARQQSGGYRLRGAFRGDTLVGLAGYHLRENFVYGRHAHIEDLVIAEADRGSGIGRALIDSVGGVAARGLCSSLALERGSANRAAQNFYARCGFATVAFHLTRRVGEQ
jgi:ribosomal protein S18 acetylase RimI-like enzyme